MSKKRAVLLMGLGLLLLALLIPSRRLAQKGTVIHQHRSYPAEQAGIDYGFDSEGVLTSHMPLFIIRSQGQTIPGSPVKTDEVLNCDYAIIDNGNGINRSTDEPAVTGHMNINIRGNSSRIFQKKQYSIRLVNGKGEAEDTSLMGMPAESSWVLNGSYIDKSMIRNYILYNLSGEIMAYSPRCRLCEVMMENEAGELEYQGVYTLIEKPKVSDLRLDLHRYDPGYKETPFLLQMNARIDNLKVDHLVVRERMLIYSLDLKYPTTEILTEASEDYIRSSVLRHEKMLYDASATENWDRVNESFDIDSFVDYYLINEIFQNYDAGIRSTYIYQDIGGKFSIGPVWDFDGAFDNFHIDHMEIEWMELQSTYYYAYLLSDPLFAQRCIERYWELRRGVFSEENLINYITETRDYIGSAAERNFDKWYGGKMAQYDNDLESMIEFVRDRGAFLDAFFAK